MKRILLPTDFSDNSWNAISYALQLYKDQECTFTLLNTYTPIIYQLEVAQLSSAQFTLEDAMKEASQTGLKTMVKRIEETFPNPKHTISTISAFNTLTDEIRTLYEGNVMDMVIMGTQGASGIKEILFGSNTVHVFNKAQCPVLAVPGDYSYDPPHEILFPSDYGIEFKPEHVAPIIDIATSHSARVNVLHVATGAELTAEQKQHKSELEAYFEDTTNLFHDVSNTDIPEAITAFQSHSRINLLVMINNKHSFFENLFFKSNIKHIGFHLNVPFLVIPSAV